MTVQPNALRIFILQQRIATLRTQASRCQDANQEKRIRHTIRNKEAQLRRIDPTAISQ